QTLPFFQGRQMVPVPQQAFPYSPYLPQSPPAVACVIIMNREILTRACHILSASGENWSLDNIRSTPLTPDGSLRRFCRIKHEDGRTALAVAPPADDSTGLKEAVSGWHIGKHLFAAEAPVPVLYEFDAQSGLLVCEDMGDQRLHDLIEEQGIASEQVLDCYRQTVTELARMQVRGREDFDSAWCWDGPCYDRAVMLERESGYFLRALCHDFLRLEIDTKKIAQEFQQMADRAAQADASFFLHRDFQSRNIMIQQGRVRFIDYQAGRLGPLGYDLASLLIDPYASLPASLQDELLELYLDALTALLPYNREQFRQEYMLLALQRNLQILGAFAFLCQQRGKPFFRQYISPALHSVQTLLGQTADEDYPYLASLCLQCSEKLNI
ncbi:MAG: hypothetical protein D3904_17135, partial [Candidatus Electrothrix sp. EH2]|nr:hypothetical protein [Candidatus Electrothrix sp. EH2]